MCVWGCVCVSVYMRMNKYMYMRMDKSSLNNPYRNEGNRKILFEFQNNNCCRENILLKLVGVTLRKYSRSTASKYHPKHTDRGDFNICPQII